VTRARGKSPKGAHEQVPGNVPAPPTEEWQISRVMMFGESQHRIGKVQGDGEKERCRKNHNGSMVSRISLPKGGNTATARAEEAPQFRGTPGNVLAEGESPSRTGEVPWKNAG